MRIHFKAWNIWRKQFKGYRIHKLFVLLRISPDMAFDTIYGFVKVGAMAKIAGKRMTELGEAMKKYSGSGDSDLDTGEKK